MAEADRTKPARLVFDSLTPDSQLQWSLQGPQGQVTAPRGLDASDANAQGGNVLMNLQAGSYTLQVDGLGDHVGDYSFRIIDIGSATAITPGQVVKGTLTPANETQAYNFNAVAGQTFYFDALSNPASTDWRLIGPDGKTAFGPTAANTDVENQLLTQTGAYTLLLEGRIRNAAASTDCRSCPNSPGTASKASRAARLRACNASIRATIRFCSGSGGIGIGKDVRVDLSTVRNVEPVPSSSSRCSECRRK